MNHLGVQSLDVPGTLVPSGDPGEQELCHPSLSRDEKASFKPIAMTFAGDELEVML